MSFYLMRRYTQRPETPVADVDPGPTVSAAGAITVRRPTPPPPPRAERPIALPTGYRALRHGQTVYSPELADAFVEAYFQAGGSLIRACTVTQVAYRAACAWRAEIPAFAQALRECDQLIEDWVHEQFMQRVLTVGENNPAWKLAYFRKHFPEYADSRRAPPTVQIAIVDSTLRPAGPSPEGAA